MYGLIGEHLEHPEPESLRHDAVEAQLALAQGSDSRSQVGSHCMIPASRVEAALLDPSGPVVPDCVRAVPAQVALALAAQHQLLERGGRTKATVPACTVEDVVWHLGCVFEDLDPGYYVDEAENRVDATRANRAPDGGPKAIRGRLQGALVD